MPMNLPNKLTIVRIIMIPFFVFFLLTDFVAGSKWIATVLFCAASLTDFLDGHIARKYNLVHLSVQLHKIRLPHGSLS